jgi:hypothetical protein
VKRCCFDLLKGQNNEDEEQNCRQRENLIKEKAISIAKNGGAKDS